MGEKQGGGNPPRDEREDLGEGVMTDSSYPPPARASVNAFQFVML